MSILIRLLLFLALLFLLVISIAMNADAATFYGVTANVRTDIGSDSHS